MSDTTERTRAGRAPRGVVYILALGAALLLCASARAQVTGGQHTLYGEFRVDESRAGGMVPISFDLILYTETGLVVERQPVGSRSTFRFINLRNGLYDIAVE